jgi:hypothetical protein
VAGRAQQWCRIRRLIVTFVKFRAAFSPESVIIPFVTVEIVFLFNLKFSFFRRIPAADLWECLRLHGYQYQLIAGDQP